jgi:hypothetical protein
MRPRLAGCGRGIAGCGLRIRRPVGGPTTAAIAIRSTLRDWPLTDETGLAAAVLDSIDRGPPSRRAPAPSQFWVASAQ